MAKQEFNKGEIAIYETPKKEVKLDVRLEKETVWLTQKQIAILFGTQRPAVTKHLNNIFKAGELNKNSVSSILEHTAADGKTYKTQFYNLDAIISVGYRVNSKRATQFRIWATKTLKDHLIKGYTINEKRLLEAREKFKAILGNIYQTFGRKELYSSLEEKAAHLLYFVIKDHPFVDGNKRTGSFLFIYFLNKNNYLYRQSGEKKINDNALTALSLLISVSDPKDKDILTKITTNLISDEHPLRRF